MNFESLKRMERIAHALQAIAPVSQKELGKPEPHTSEMELLSPIMNLAKKFNCFFLSGFHMGMCKAFIMEGFQIGIITPEVFSKLREYPEVFICGDASVQLVPKLNDYESRSNAVDKVLRELRKDDAFVTLRGWRDECYEVRVDLQETSLMQMERSATCLFGIRQFGVDINGYVKHPDLGLCLWLQKRSSTKQRWAGKLDNIVGGGLSVGYSVFETAHKEAAEEASIPESILQHLKPVGTVSIFYESERGLSPNTEHVFDLELPLDFVPVNQDGEVDSFHLYPVSEALKVIISPDFKTTSCPVALDFLIRHGVISLENEPDLAVLKELLHIPLNCIYGRLTNNSKQDEQDEISACP